MFERCLYFNVNALARTVNRKWDTAFARFELSPAHAYLLRLALSSPGLTPKQLAQQLKLEKSTITRFLNALEKKNLIMRKNSDSGDAREQSIYASRKAEKIASKLEQQGDELYQQMVKAIGKKELTELVKNLRKIEAQLN